MTIFNGDCLEEMKKLPDKSVDLFICDLPYGETNCKWDSIIDMEQFWVQFKRLRKSKRTACIHFCSTKFGYSLIKSWEKGFKMDMVWKKRNKTGGLASRFRPMRNHEMVYFFYEQAPKYNRDKYHKRINNVKMAKSEHFNTGTNFDTKNEKVRPGLVANFEPPNPASVIDEKYTKEHIDNNRAGAGTNEGSEIYTKEAIKKYQKENGVGFEPPNPASVIDENHVNVYGFDKSHPTWAQHNSFDPPNPASVVEEFIEPVEDEPVTMFESEKVFIGKRNHQTEKPQDILEFFLKYWSDEGDVILDPTMGSGSTGVACKKMGREFIGFELTEKYFEVAKNRLA